MSEPTRLTPERLSAIGAAAFAYALNVKQFRWDELRSSRRLRQATETPEGYNLSQPDVRLIVRGLEAEELIEPDPQRPHYWRATRLAILLAYLQGEMLAGARFTFRSLLHYSPAFDDVGADVAWDMLARLSVRRFIEPASRIPNDIRETEFVIGTRKILVESLPKMQGLEPA